MKIYEIGGYRQMVTKKGITCTCRWSTVYCNNYKNGGKICRHIKLLLQNDKKD